MNTLNQGSTIKSKFAIFFAQQRRQFRDRACSKQLIVGNMVYETLVNGIDQALNEKDFRGIIKIKYEFNQETGYLIFALWFCPKTKTHFLTSLGQHSETSYLTDLTTYQQANRPGKRMHIHLFPIHQGMLKNLEVLLNNTHLSQANVVILKDTVLRQEILIH